MKTQSVKVSSPELSKCPVCSGETVISEDWDFGRVIICEQGHYRRVQRFGGDPPVNVLEKGERTDVD